MTGRSVLLDGGPAEGVLAGAHPAMHNGVWTIEIGHVNCSCEWCRILPGPLVIHTYVSDSNDVFVYRGSSSGI